MIYTSGRVPGIALAIVALASPALGQDEPKFALLASFPSPTVSMQWELSERFAVRVDGSYTFLDNTLIESVPGESSTTMIGSSTVVVGSPDLEARSETTAHSGTFGVSGIYTFHRSEQLRLYLAPRLSLGFTSQTITSTITAINVPPGFPSRFLDGLVGTQVYESSSKSPGAGLAFGAAANIIARVALYGEAGFNYVRTTTPEAALIGLTRPRESTDSRRTTLNTRAVGGVMFRF